MTEPTTPNGLAVRVQPDALAEAAEDFGLPRNFPDQMALAELISKSSLVPKPLQGNAANVFLIVQKAIGLKVSLDLALAQTHVIDNKVTPSAELLRILLRRAGHDLEITLHNDKIAKATLTLAHRPNKPITMEYTIAKAQAAGLTNKPVWKQHPESMLIAALTRLIVRFHCPEVATGLSLDVEMAGAEFGLPTEAPPAGRVQASAERVDDEPDIPRQRAAIEESPATPQVDEEPQQAEPTEAADPAPEPDPKAVRAGEVLDEALAAEDVATLTRLGKEARSGGLLTQVVDAEGLTLKEALMNRLHVLESGASVSK